MAKRCPACHAKVPDDALDCPYCPESFRHDEEGTHTKSRHAHVPFLKVVMILAVIAAAGLAAWQSLTYVIEHADSPESDFSRANLESGPRPAAERKAPPQQSGGSYRTYRVGEEPPAAQETEPAPGGGGFDDSNWRLRGTVYDLVSLEPLSGVSITFIDAHTNRRLRTETDRRGRYRAVLPSLRLRAYSVKINRDGYAQEYLSPSVEGVGSMPVEERRNLAKQLSESVNGPYEVAPSGGQPLTTDFYLAPLP